MHALYQVSGDAVIGIVADLQDPPEMIEELIRKWEEGYPVVIMVKEASDESGLMFWIRKQYYRLVNRLSGVETYENLRALDSLIARWWRSSSSLMILILTSAA